MKTTKNITVEIYTPKTLEDLETLKSLILEKSGQSMGADILPFLDGYKLYFGSNTMYDEQSISVHSGATPCELWYIPEVGFNIIKKSS